MNKGKILVVDDEPAVRLLLRSMLSEEYTVVEAGDGKQALTIAGIEPPDLILMDIMMPRMDGYVACGRIKKDPFLKEIPVVMLTAVGYELNKKLAREVGAEGYITKPFDLQELMAIINRLIKK
jgi:two-component system alkaline phosphatase synthesis response regulator PhoP